MRNLTPSTKIVRKSNQYYRECAIQPQMVSNKDEFECRSYFIYGTKREKTSIIEISNKYGSFLNIDITKVGEKRNRSLSYELDLNEVDVLIGYLQKVRSELTPSRGEIISELKEVV